MLLLVLVYMPENTLFLKLNKGIYMAIAFRNATILLITKFLSSSRIVEFLNFFTAFKSKLSDVHSIQGPQACPHSLFQCLHLLAKRDSKQNQWIQGRYKPDMLSILCGLLGTRK